LFVHDKREDSIGKIRQVVHEYKGMINEAGIKLGKDFELELSHHYGIDNFREIGILIINIMNREYCKKLICLLPNQKNPNHYHKKKEETFQVIWGNLKVNLDGKIYNLYPGDKLLVEREKMHDFYSETGAIFEEISTTHHRDDSFYEDPEINKLDPMERKTKINEW
jgi:N-acetylneuraminate synthase